MYYTIFEKLKHIVDNFIHSKLSSQDTQDNIIAYCSGHVLTTVFFLGGITQALIQLGAKVIVAIIIGVIGGAAGLIGKDLYEHFKIKVKTRKNKK